MMTRRKALGLLIGMAPLGWGLRRASAQTQSPSISSASGTWGHGGTVTITGSGFGAKSPAAPTVWDDCTGTNVLAKWDGAWPDTNGANYILNYRTISAANGRSIATGPHTRVSKYLCGCHTPSSLDGADVAMWKTRTASLPMYLYLSYYYRMDPNWDFGDPSLRNQKMFAYASGSTPYAQPYWYYEFRETWDTATDNSAQWYSPYNPGWGSHYDALYSPFQNWMKIETEIRFATDSSGYVKIWENGSPSVNKTGIATDLNSGTVRTAAIAGYANPYGSTSQWRYFNDVYFDWTLARVLLGNQSTYNNCTIREAQIPTAWADGSITVKVNLGKLPNTGTAYLYVVNTGGVVSASQPITLSSQATIPSSPGSLRVVP